MSKYVHHSRFVTSFLWLGATSSKTDGDNIKMEIIDAPGKNSREIYKKTKLIGRTQNACLYGVTFHEGNGNYVIDVDGNKVCAQ